MRIPSSAHTLTSMPFQIDHVIARKHGGGTSDDNLAFACFYCSSHKGPNIAGLDPRSSPDARHDRITSS